MPKRYINDGPLFATALAKTHASSRQAIMIVISALTAAKVIVEELSFSHTYFTKAQCNSCEVLAAEVLHNLKPTVPLV